MIRVGLTGGIATGKSTVAQLLREVNFPVLDADQVARDIVQRGSPTLLQIQNRFGPNVLLPSGDLNRDALRQIILTHPDAKRDLEALTHPLIQSKIQKWMDDQATEGHGAAVVEAALLVETGSYVAYDLLVVVTTTAENQLKRLLARNPISKDEALGWISKQLPLTQKEQLADLVIRNDGSKSDLMAEVQRLMERLPPPRSTLKK